MRLAPFKRVIGFPLSNHFAYLFPPPLSCTVIVSGDAGCDKILSTYSPEDWSSFWLERKIKATMQVIAAREAADRRF